MRPGPSGAPEVVTLGEVMVALVAAEPGPLAENGSFLRHVAGAEANVAVGLARLGHRAAFIGRVGSDAFGTAIRRRLLGEGIDCSCLAVDPTGPTGILIRERRFLGSAEVLYYRRDSAGSHVSEGDVQHAAGLGLFGTARWLHLTGITPALSASAAGVARRGHQAGRGRATWRSASTSTCGASSGRRRTRVGCSPRWPLGPTSSSAARTSWR